MASSADHFRPPNQRRSMRSQLEHGIRGFQIDAYFGTPRRGRVYTDLSGPLGKAAELPAPLVAAANQLHRRLGAPPAGTPYDLYLCHVFCELGAVKMVDEMHVVRQFLDTHPREVVVMVIEDYVPADRILAVLRDAGLESMLLPVVAGEPLPTLQQMIDAGTRLQVSLENGDGGPTLPNAFTGLVEETPFTFFRPRNLEAASSCTANRGTPDSPLFQFNHWVTPAEPVTARAGEFGDPARADHPLHRRARTRAHSRRRRLRRAGRPARPGSYTQPMIGVRRGRSIRCRRWPTRRCRGTASSTIRWRRWRRRAVRAATRSWSTGPTAARCSCSRRPACAASTRCRSRRQQGRRRLDDAAPQAARRAVRRAAHDAPRAVRARRRPDLSHRARRRHRRRVRGARRRRRGRRVRVHPPARAPDGAGGLGR